MKAKSSNSIARRSARKKHKDEKQDTSTDHAEKSSERTVDNSKRQLQKVVKRRMIGRLADLPSMPLDILFEIFGQLLPYDLLKLARTTRDFRRLLMNRSSISVWKAARVNSGLPGCPTDMSEPAWAHLAFFPQCNYCSATNIRNVEWRFRVRICSKCAGRHLADIRRYSSYFESMVSTRPGKRRSVICFKPEIESVESRFCAIEGNEARQSFINERKKIVHDRLQHAKLCEVWNESQTQDRDTELWNLREDRRHAIFQKLEDLGWGHDISQIQQPDSLELHKLVDRPQRLTELWSNIKPGVLEFMEEMRAKRIEREFASLVLSRKFVAIRVLREYKNSRLPDIQLMPEGPDFCEFPAIKEILHQPADITVEESSFSDVVPQLASIMEDWRMDLDRRLLKSIRMDSLRPLSRKRFYLKMLNSLHGMFSDEEYETSESLPPMDNKPQMTDEILSHRMKLASALYSCPSCTPSSRRFDYDSDFDDGLQHFTSNALFYPQVLGHQCWTRTEAGYFDMFYNPAACDQTLRLAASEDERKGWDCYGLSFKTSKIAEYIVQEAGLDSDIATANDMDQVDCMFACLTCREPMINDVEGGSDESETSGDDNLESITSSVCPLFNWRAAIRHLTEQHRSLSSLGMMEQHIMKFTKESLSTEVKETERRYRTKNDTIWACVHCRDLPSEKGVYTLSEVENHVSQRHQSASPTLNVDYFRHFAASDMHPTSAPFLVCVRDGHVTCYERVPVEA
ncbi:hypothetical protein B0H34DRAFT_22362 [Crassisporium funariophilum]|nr:hypothetical protein B0H34DRAFT_22362 [Crassisporium funariophilum]